MCHLCEAQEILDQMKADAARIGDPVLEGQCLVYQSHLDARKAFDMALTVCDAVLTHQPSHPLAHEFAFMRERMRAIDKSICDMGEQMAFIIAAGDVTATPGSDTVN